jgi:hypothetical protein
MDSTHQVDARYQYRFAYGDIVCYQLSEKEPLTFAFMMQIAIAMGLICCTADIKAAYLNVPRPAGEIPILTKLESFVAEICELDPNQLYCIDKCLYGSPDSGRHFYRHYRDALIEEGYIMSNMDNCLFYKITEE